MIYSQDVVLRIPAAPKILRKGFRLCNMQRLPVSDKTEWAMGELRKANFLLEGSTQQKTNSFRNIRLSADVFSRRIIPNWGITGGIICVSQSGR